MKRALSEENRKKLDCLSQTLASVDNLVDPMLKRAMGFKGRKSAKLAAKAISALCSEEEAVFEPFFGSGSFVIAAVLAHRRVTATELDNYTFFAVETLFTKVDSAKVWAMFRQVEAQARAELMELYATECCGRRNYVAKLLFDQEPEEYFHPTPNREIRDGRNVKLTSPCPVCHKRAKAFGPVDQNKLEKLKTLDVSRFPDVCYLENSRINITASAGADRYARIFTKRNQKALLLLQDAILQLPQGAERDVLEQALVASLALARTAMYGSSTDILYHVVAKGAQEMNVWLLFEKKLNCIMRFKTAPEYSALQQTSPRKNPRYALIPGDYQAFAVSCPEECFSLVYTDFPYTDQVPYLERHQLFRVWLNTFYQPGSFLLTQEMLRREIVQTNAKKRGDKQGIDAYYRDMDQMFHTFCRVLKPRGLVAVTLKLGKNKYFATLNGIINLARKNGFEYALRIGLDKNDPTLRKQSAYVNTLSNEMLVVFEKLPPEERYWYVGDEDWELRTVRLVYEEIHSAGKELSLTSGVMLVRDALLREKDHFATQEELQGITKIIKSNFAVNSPGQRLDIDENRLYLELEDKTSLFMKFYQMIPPIIRRLLEKQTAFVLEDLYFELTVRLCTGDPGTIRQFLESGTYQRDIHRLLMNYCVSNGKYYEKRPYDEPHKEGAMDISTMEGREFERLIKRLLLAEGCWDVVNTGGSGDFGVDLMAKRQSGGTSQTVLYQCKRWLGKVGSEPIQRLAAERERRGADAAVCIISSYFSRDGITAYQDFQVEAVDGPALMRRLDLCFPGAYYNRAL